MMLKSCDRCKQTVPADGSDSAGLPDSIDITFRFISSGQAATRRLDLCDTCQKELGIYCPVQERLRPYIRASQAVDAWKRWLLHRPE